MFEQGFRADDNKQQAMSYGMCVNCLALVSPENAWILKPKTNQVDDPMDENEEEVMCMTCTRHLIKRLILQYCQSFQLFCMVCRQECLEIFELSDLKREYELSMARAKLLNCPPGKH